MNENYSFLSTFTIGQIAFSGKEPTYTLYYPTRQKSLYFSVLQLCAMIWSTYSGHRRSVWIWVWPSGDAPEKCVMFLVECGGGGAAAAAAVRESVEGMSS